MGRLVFFEADERIGALGCWNIWVRERRCLGSATKGIGIWLRYGYKRQRDFWEDDVDLVALMRMWGVGGGWKYRGEERGLI